MSITILTDECHFPEVNDSYDADGLIALGGKLTTDNIVKAYKAGLFPWYSEDEPIMWWCPDPRCVIEPSKVRISKSMKTNLQSGRFHFTINRSFAEVITACATQPREGQDGTWITKDIIEAYTKLNEDGVAHSAECWQEGKLVGGLYGLKIGNIFFGESMFSLMSNASKYAFIKMMQHLQQVGITLVDCQVDTSHLRSMGARLIPRSEFLQKLKEEYN